MGSDRITGGILPGHHAIDDIPKTETKAGTSIVRTRNISNATTAASDDDDDGDDGDDGGDDDEDDDDDVGEIPPPAKALEDCTSLLGISSSFRSVVVIFDEEVEYDFRETRRTVTRTGGIATNDVVDEDDDDDDDDSAGLDLLFFRVS